MSVRPTGESASILPWFWPDAGSLALLSQSPVLPWNDLRDDPGAVLLMLAHHDPLSCDYASESPSPDLLRHAAGALMDRSVHWVNWRDPKIEPIYKTCLATARLSAMIAEFVGSCDPIAAWCGGILAHAGWLAVATVDPDAPQKCLSAKGFELDPWGAQLKIWGASRADISWKLACEWNLPNWAKILMGGLSYAPVDADRVGGLARLHAVVHTAIALAEEFETPLGISGEFNPSEAHAELMLRSADIETIRTRYAGSRHRVQLLRRDWQNPLESPGLANKLEDAADRLLEAETDSQTLPFTQAADEQFHSAKLEALAEFAAGASHEINTPLAVISANSQYLLKQGPSENQRKALETIVRQTERVHGILRELMMFARPPAPKFAAADVCELATKAIEQLRPVADERSVRLDLSLPGNPIPLEVDSDQIQNIILALVRNGIDAAGSKGCVRLRVALRSERIELIVEDSGPGMDQTTREHLFDPFYCGRTAGRGRGLGLPTAWQLARQHGGDVRFVPVPNGLTRFVCTLPTSVPNAVPARKSA